MRQRPYDVLPVQVELAKGGGDGIELQQRLERAIKSRLGATARVKLLAAGSFPVTEGKTRRVLRTCQ